MKFVPIKKKLKINLEKSFQSHTFVSSNKNNKDYAK